MNFMFPTTTNTTAASTTSSGSLFSLGLQSTQLSDAGSKPEPLNLSFNAFLATTTTPSTPAASTSQSPFGKLTFSSLNIPTSTTAASTTATTTTAGTGLFLPASFNLPVVGTAGSTVASITSSSPSLFGSVFSLTGTPASATSTTPQSIQQQTPLSAMPTTITTTTGLSLSSSLSSSTLVSSTGPSSTTGSTALIVPANYSLGGTAGKTTEQKPGHVKLPNDLQSSINNFKTFLQEQKKLKSECARIFDTSDWDFDQPIKQANNKLNRLRNKTYAISIDSARTKTLFHKEQRVCELLCSDVSTIPCVNGEHYSGNIQKFINDRIDGFLANIDSIDETLRQCEEVANNEGSAYTDVTNADIAASLKLLQRRLASVSRLVSEAMQPGKSLPWR